MGVLVMFDNLMVSRAVASCVLLIALVVVPVAASAETLAIQYTGLDIRYDGSTIATVGGFDPLQSVDFAVDEINVASLNSPGDSPLAIAINIPGVTGMPIAGGSITSAAGGTLSLQLPGGDYLDLQLDAAEIVYVALDSLKLYFALGAGSADLLGQALPIPGFAGDIAVSFSTQVKTSTLKTDGVFVTGFDAAGTGEIKGTQVPEPAGVALLLSGLLVCLAGRRRG
jgi:hypothetical protein